MVFPVKIKFLLEISLIIGKTKSDDIFIMHSLIKYYLFQ